MYLFIFLTPYMFRAHRAHHQERQIVSIQPLVACHLPRKYSYYSPQPLNYALQYERVATR